MPKNTDNPFPAFIITREVDARGVTSCLELHRTLMACISCHDQQGNDHNCLAWFTDEALANEHMQNCGLRGTAIPITGPEEAAEFLERHQFAYIAVNPVSATEQFPHVILSSDLMPYLLGDRR